MIKFTKKQLEKIADQLRLLSWAQGAIFITGFHVSFNWASILLVGIFWIGLQGAALHLDKRSDSHDNCSNGSV